MHRVDGQFGPRLLKLGPFGRFWPAKDIRSELLRGGTLSLLQPSVLHSQALPGAMPDVPIRVEDEPHGSFVSEQHLSTISG